MAFIYCSWPIFRVRSGIRGVAINKFHEQLNIILFPPLFSSQKSFAPTIPTSRRVKKEKEEPETTPTKRGRDERRDKKDRGKGRRREKEIIASASVFSMGPADRGLARGRGK